ncbi:MAG TPA: substrate-binding domain-containing protein [Jatrophihabitantaceae bacterium]
MREGQQPRTSRGARRVLVAAVAAAAALLAACSSSTPSKSGSPGGGTSAADDAGGAAVVAKAQAFIKPYLSAPTKIPLTVPLKAAPARGKTIVFLQCELAQCKGIGNGVQAAAQVVGWTFKSIPYQSTNPSTLASALDQALQYKPVAVALTSPPYAIWSQKVAAYKAAGVPLVPSFTGKVPIDSTIIANPASPEYAALNGQILGNWFIADSNAKGHVLSVGVNDFPYLAGTTDGFNTTVKNDCSGCKLTKLNVGIPDVGNGSINNIIVSALRKDPSINYVVPVDAVFAAALPSALAAAGLTGKVKVAGCCGDTTTEAGLATGQFQAITGVNGGYAGFITVDAAARAAEGSPMPENEGILPVGLLTKGTSVKPADSYNEPADFVAQFKALWKLG